jgi:hypothetical protein
VCHRGGGAGRSRPSRQLVATVSAFLTVGFSHFDEPTVNSNCELTVATSWIARVFMIRRSNRRSRRKYWPSLGRGDWGTEKVCSALTVFWSVCEDLPSLLDLRALHGTTSKRVDRYAQSSRAKATFSESWSENLLNIPAITASVGLMFL